VDTLARPANVHAGSCELEELGEILTPLSDLTVSEGDGQGQSARAVAVASSFTNVPLTLDDLIGADHAVVIDLSLEEIDTYLACGEIGGVPDPSGALVIGLKEYEGSGFAGIAFLSPGADEASTDVSVFLAEGLGGIAAAMVDVTGGEKESGAEATPTASAKPAPLATPEV